jgi:hypothetical protein
VPAAVIAISMLVALTMGTPSKASHHCMSKAQARQHFGSVHLYWHGRAHCWDATAPGRVRESRKAPAARWRDALSEILPESKSGILPESKSGILPESKPVQTIVAPSWLERWVDIGPSQLPLAADKVDSGRPQSPPVAERESRSGFSPRLLLLACIAVAIGLTLATIEFLFRRTIYD